ncbi:hypothetical protein [Paeniglutamicibacter cryotolerans]|uniref:Uncharacterized protein n=1 Tax=Paeniglutamicibacter cryotolerans TaxID=670079 RepID=A0A839QUW3_9MICC|nr:hypothetical protein [Paeniglutamicibacter cryotolerans]MBB2997092.1 hypothetical protein [Paeniglutamicibacter cryotolerans]
MKKTGVGAKATKVHDKPATPHQRAIAHPAMRKMPVIRMNSAFKKIRVMALSRQIMALTGRLETLAKAKGGTATDHLKKSES